MTIEMFDKLEQQMVKHAFAPRGQLDQRQLVEALREDAETYPHFAKALTPLASKIAALDDKQFAELMSDL